LLASLGLFAGCLAIYRLVVRLDRAAEPDDRAEGSGPWLVG
jgi:hypothetical protein